MSIQRIAMWNGCEFIGDSTPRTGKSYDSFQVNEDCEITAMTGKNANGDTVNFLEDSGLDGSPVPTLKQGIIYSVPIGSFITNITVASGSIIAGRTK